MDPEAERKAREIVLAARGERKRWPRAVWIAAIVLGIGCATAFAIAWWQDKDTVSEHPLDRHAATQTGGLGFGLLVGLGVGIAIGSLLAVKRKRA